eukprot:5754844-Lingulodinium_polyedra.AAC.1
MCAATGGLMHEARSQRRPAFVRSRTFGCPRRLEVIRPSFFRPFMAPRWIGPQAACARGRSDVHER